MPFEKIRTNKWTERKRERAKRICSNNSHILISKDACDVHGIAVIKIVLQVDDDWNIKQTLRFETDLSGKANNYSRALWQCVLCGTAACRRWKLFALLLILQRKRIRSTVKESFFSTLKEQKNKINKSIYSDIFFSFTLSFSLYLCVWTILLTKTNDFQFSSTTLLTSPSPVFMLFFLLTCSSFRIHSAYKI